MKPGHAASPSAVEIDAKETASCVGRHVQVAVAAESDPIEPGALCVRRQKLLVEAKTSNVEASAGSRRTFGPALSVT